MNQEIKIIAPSKNIFQNIKTALSKNVFQDIWYTLELLSQKIHFRTLVHIKTALSQNVFRKIPTIDY